MTYSTVPNDKLRALCIKNNWFTCGSNAQYDKLFHANASGATIEEIATIIWLCSDDDNCRRDILAELKQARADWTRSMVCVTEKSITVKDEVLSEIEEAQTMAGLFHARAMMCNALLSHEDFIDCYNAFVLKRAELKGETK